MKPVPYLLTAILLTGLLACQKEEGPSYEIPDAYDFENVNYDGQLQRLAMLSEMKSYMATANESGVSLDPVRLLAMFANDEGHANWQGTYEDSKQLKNKTFENQQALFESFIDSLAVASQSSTPAENGKAGRLTSLDGEKTYLLGANGAEYLQFIEKGLMGACFYWQATGVYMGEDRMNVDNEEVIPGKGTKMEHHWDEAFGYFGVPKNYPADTDGAIFWGDYALDRNPIVGTAEQLMQALIKGRAAISAGDLETRDEAIGTARQQWEIVSVGTALHYINASLSKFDDPARRLHALSEAIAFTYDLQFNPERSITLDEVGQLLDLLGGDRDFERMNLWSVTESDLQQARTVLAGIYGLDGEADQF